MLNRLAGLAIAAPRRVIAVAVLVMVAAAAFGILGLGRLVGGGELDPGAGSSRANAMLAGKFGRGGTDLLITVTAAGGARGALATAVGTELVAQLRNSPHVGQVLSPWTAQPEQARSMVSTDGATGLIVATVSGSDAQAGAAATQLTDELVHDRDGVVMRAGGDAIVNEQVNEQTRKDLLVMETVALPLSFLVLVWVFGGLVAAALPMAVGIFAIFGSLAALRLIASFTDVSIFALNLCIAMGTALAVDYTLLIVSRFRDEIADGRGREDALRRTVGTAGRTVLFSAMTVGLSMATLLLFPQYFLRSFAYAGVAVVVFAAAASITVTPAVIAFLGTRLDALDVRPALRRVFWGVSGRSGVPVRWSWFGLTRYVMAHAVPIGVVITVLLLVLGAPFAKARWGFADDRILPSSASSRQVGDLLRNGFPAKEVQTVTAVIPDAGDLTAADLGSYATALSLAPDVAWVAAPGGAFAGGKPAGLPSAPAAVQDGSAFLTVGSTAAPYSPAAIAQLDRLSAVPTPAGRAVWLTGLAASNRDSVKAIGSRVPLVLAAMAVITLVLLFLLTGSIVLPIKAAVMNLLSLSAAFGALVWVFQEGHLGGLGTAATGTLGVQLPVLLFCIAFGLSMDYEVFLIARIREYWLASDRSTAANDESIALGVAHTGRVITAAALIMTVSFAALMTARVSFMRLFGFGLTVAILADATLVRMLLVPAFMHVLGRLNWWAPTQLARAREATAGENTR